MITALSGANFRPTSILSKSNFYRIDKFSSGCLVVLGEYIKYTRRVIDGIMRFLAKCDHVLYTFDHRSVTGFQFGRKMITETT